MKQHGSNYFAHTPLLPTQIHTHITSVGWDQKVKIKLFHNMVMFHMKLNI